MSQQNKTWKEYFASLSKLIATRSSCCRRQVGAVLVKNNRVVSTGYNGTPAGMKNCNEGGCPRCNNATFSDPATLLECICVHAEENAIIQAAICGTSTIDTEIYVTCSPCLHCMKILASAGVKKVFYLELYDTKALDVFKEIIKTEKLE